MKFSIPGRHLVLNLNSLPERFNEVENVIDKIDAENKEVYIIGDVNCNLLPEASARNPSYLTFLAFMVLVNH